MAGVSCEHGEELLAYAYGSMKITSVQLTHVRNHQHTVWTGVAGVNLVYGPNGSGKSTILEAIRLACLGSSWRTKQTQSLVQFSRDTMQIDLTITHKQTASTIRCVYQPTAGTAMIRQRNHRTISLHEMIGDYPLVVFTPNDSQLISGGPHYRRTFLDQLITQQTPSYLHTLRAYKHAISQRNQLLKQIRHTPSLASTLDAWDEHMTESAIKIQSERTRVVQELQELLPEAYARVSHSNDPLAIQYTPTHPPERLLEALHARREDDIRRGQTSVGPHRDAVSLSLHQQPIELIGSRGEQRSAILALKRAEFSLLMRLQKTEPIVLLDDVLSELDPDRQQQLLGLFDQAQVICTTTYIPEHLPVHTITVTPVPHNNALPTQVA